MSGRSRMNTGDSAHYGLPPNRPDGLANCARNALLEPALKSGTNYTLASEFAGYARGGEESLEDFVGEQPPARRKTKQTAVLLHERIGD